MDLSAFFIPNNTFEFYLPLPNDGRIYRVTYNTLHLSEVARLLNNNINLSHIPDYEFLHHYNIHSLIKQQFVGPQRNNNIQLQAYSNSNINSHDSYIVSSAPQNTYEFYLSNDMFIYHITYTELNSFEIAQLLNDSINNNNYYNSQSLIQPPVESQNYQNSIQQQTFDTISIQDYSDNNIYSSADFDSENMQDTTYTGYVGNAGYDETAPTQNDY
jgi:hypothetical protein